MEDVTVIAIVAVVLSCRMDTKYRLEAIAGHSTADTALTRLEEPRADEVKLTCIDGVPEPEPTLQKRPLVYEVSVMWLLEAVVESARFTFDRSVLLCS